MPQTTYQSLQAGSTLAEVGANGEVTLTINGVGLTFPAADIAAIAAGLPALKVSGGRGGVNAAQAAVDKAQRAIDAAIAAHGEGSQQVREARAALAAING